MNDIATSAEQLAKLTRQITQVCKEIDKKALQGKSFKVLDKKFNRLLVKLNSI